MKIRASIGAILLAAGILAAQPAHQSLLGTVTQFKIGAHTAELGIQPDDAATRFVPFGPRTEVVRVAPGQHDLSGAEAAKVTDIAAGDRVMVTFVEGMADARRIILISAEDIARRNEAYRADWQKRGISGVVAGKNGDEIELRVGQGTAKVAIGERTTLRRYAPDTVRFADARFSNAADISIGDQLQARGDKSEDGTRVKAEEVVFGTFLTLGGSITAIDAGAGTITIQELKTQKPLTVHVTADSKLKALPDMHEMMSHMQAGGGHTGGGTPQTMDMRQVLEHLPAATIGELKVGEKVVLTSTKGERRDAVTAIMLLANADMVIGMMEAQAGHGEASPAMEEMIRRHGMAPGTFSLPAILQ